MTVDLDLHLFGVDGTPVLVDDKPVTLRYACTEALCALYRGEESLSGAERYRRYEIAKKLNDNHGSAELTVEEIVVIKDCVGKRFAPGLLGPIYDALEGK